MQETVIGELGSEVVDIRYSTSKKKATKGWIFTSSTETRSEKCKRTSYTTHGRIIEYADGSVSVVIGDIDEPNCKVNSYVSWGDLFNKLI